MVPDPSFLICSERSGSNLIRAIVDAHSQVFAPPPYHIGRLFWAQIHRYGDLNNEENWRTLLNDLSVYLSMLPVPVPFTVQELAAVKTRSFKDLYLHIYQHGMKLKNKSNLFIKEILTYNQLYFLLRYFPQAKFVYQVRDPRDFLASCKKSGEQFNRLPHSLKVWETDQTKSIEALYALPSSQIFVLRYEDLLGDPETVLRALCQFMELPFEAGMLKFHETEEAKTAAGKHKFWRNLAKPLIATNSGKYKKTLSKVEVDMVEIRVGKLMMRFGYEPESTSFSWWRRELVRLYELEPFRMMNAARDKLMPFLPKEERERAKPRRDNFKAMLQRAEASAPAIQYAYLKGGNHRSAASAKPSAALSD